MRPGSSCKGCMERRIGCHSVCAAYIAYKARVEEWRAKVREGKERVWIEHTVTRDRRRRR